MSTSKPRSAKPLAITLAPLSCPSYPILAMRILGLRPYFSENILTFFKAVSYSCFPYSFVFSIDSLEYAPRTSGSAATCLPHTFSTAYEISPTVARNLAASIASSNKLPCCVVAASVIASSAKFTAF